jgi:hypothetical protein
MDTGVREMLVVILWKKDQCSWGKHRGERDLERKGGKKWKI